MSDCGPSTTDKLGLRIGAIFVILFTSMFGTLFPIFSKRVPFLRKRISPVVFEFAKFFGSGVILATGFIHLLKPAADSELGPSNLISAGGCLPEGWGEYPYAFGICLTSLFATFVLQLVAFRLGTERLARLGIMDTEAHPHITGNGHPHAEGVMRAGKTSEVREQGEQEKQDDSSTSGESTPHDASEDNPAAAQLMGVAILEFGVILHSLIIGLTLAVTGSDEFNILFIVIIFHQMFEGLGLGTRLAFLTLPKSLDYLPFAGAMSYACVTPIGMAIGLGLKESISMTSASASIAAGVLDSASAGILIYTATVELMAHEFIFNRAYQTCSWGKLSFSIGSFGAGAGIMALLGKWA